MLPYNVMGPLTLLKDVWNGWMCFSNSSMYRLLCGMVSNWCLSHIMILRYAIKYSFQRSVVFTDCRQQCPMYMEHVSFVCVCSHTCVWMCFAGGLCHVLCALSLWRRTRCYSWSIIPLVAGMSSRLWTEIFSNNLSWLTECYNVVTASFWKQRCYTRM